MLTSTSLAVAMLLGLAQAGTKEEWRSRSIYQLLTDRFWRTDGSTEGCANIHEACGGTFKGIQDKLDYIQGMGFDAIWISPIPDNKWPEDYHGYGARDWEKVNEHFGGEQDLKDLVNACHEKGIWVMLDVVANHVSYYAYDDFSNINPFNKAEYFHNYCDITDWNDQWQIENCWLSGLPDLDQSNEFVKDYLYKWVNRTVEEFGFDGLRVDTERHVEIDFWAEYNRSAGVYAVGEVMNGDVGYCANYQRNALDSVLNYPQYYAVHQNVFTWGHSMYEIRTYLDNQFSQFADSSILGNFIDDHDVQRFLHNASWNQLKNSLAFNFFTTGIPILYYGTEQGYAGGSDPDNRETLWTNMNDQHELYKYVSVLNRVRQEFKVWELDQEERYVDDEFYAFRRGEVVIATTNKSSGDVSTRKLIDLPHADGTVICNQLDTSDCLTVYGGSVEVNLSNALPKIYAPQQNQNDEELFLTN